MRLPARWKERAVDEVQASPRAQQTAKVRFNPAVTPKEMRTL